MQIERQMRAVEREIVFHRQLERAIKRAGDRLQSGPEQTVMHDQQINSVLDRHLDRATDASTAAPIFVTAPEFSICSPLSAFG